MTPALQREFEKGLGCCNAVRPTIEFLEELVKLAPEWAMRVQELRSKMEHQREVCELGLQIMQANK